MTDCTNDSMRDLLPLLARGALGGAEEARVRAHLEGCASCRAERDVLTQAAATIASATPRVSESRILAGVLARTQGAAQAQAQAQAHSRALASLQVVRAPRRRPVVSRGFLAAAASLLIVGTLSLSAIAKQISGLGTHIGPASDSGAVSAVDPGKGPIEPTEPTTAPDVGLRVAEGPSTMLEGLSDLDGDELTALLASLDAVQATVEADPVTYRAPLVRAPEDN